MTEFDENTPIGGYKFPEKLAQELYEFCEKVDKEIGTNNGSTALFWHIITIFDMHTSKKELDNDDTFQE